MRRKFGWAIVAFGLSTAALPPAAAQAQERAAAAGFLLQGALTAATPITAYSPGTFVMFGLGLGGSLRAGWMFDSAAVVLDVSYASFSDDNSYDGNVRLGPLAEVFLWRSGDGTARIYALAGAQFGAWIHRQDAPRPGEPAEEDDTFLAGLKLGFGGCYFLHPNFLLGFELGADTSFVGAEDSDIISSFFAALTLGFVAGS